MMKKILLGLIMIVAIGSTHKVTAQENQSTDTLSYMDKEVRKYAAIYELAVKFNDQAVAKNALYNILMYTSNQNAILDSLALMYFDSRQYISAAIAASESVKFNPNDELALEVAAISFNSLGVKERALEYFEKLFLKNDDTNTLYQMAFLQFETKKLKESMASVNILLERPDVNEIKFNFTKVDNTNQEVPMKAAILNLKGLIQKEEGDKEAAKATFLEAIQASPGFELAQANLASVK